MFVLNILCTCRRLPSTLQPNTHLSNIKLFSTHNVFYTPRTRQVLPHTTQNISTSSITNNDNNSEQQKTNTTTVSNIELEKFKTLAPEWWKNDGEFIALKSLNKLRVPLIKELACGRRDVANPSQPLAGIKILDVGCGGGILAESLARLGANVVGIDPLQENIDAAEHHRGEHSDLAKLSYTCTTVEDFCREHGESFDVVVASEVLEHVDNPAVFVEDCCSCIKPGGRIVVTTINRNIVSTLLVKYAAEYLLRIVPQGTHDEGKFVTPEELVDMLRLGTGMVGINFKGMTMNPATLKWSWSPTTVMNYACYATKPMQ